MSARHLLLLFSCLAAVARAGPPVETREPVALRVGPAAHLPVIESLPAGLVAEVLERSGGWYRVRVDRMMEGWLPLYAVAVRAAGDGQGATPGRLDREGLTQAAPRWDDVHQLMPVAPTRAELRNFADAARLRPGRVPR